MTIYDLFSKEHCGEPEPFVESNVALTDLAKRRDDRVGHFTDVTDTLSPLYADPDGRGSRRWREIFGFERPLPRGSRGAFIVSEALRSSSDSRSTRRR
jgi:hypothetical protein